jgi:cytochrome P450
MIGKIAFGVEMNSLHQKSVPVLQAFDHALKTIEWRLLHPYWKLLPDKAMKNAIAVLDKFAMETISDRRQNASGKQDLLSLYIINTTKSDSDLRDVMMNFLLAGRDTTGQTLTWFFFLLTQNPQIEAKAKRC